MAPTEIEGRFSDLVPKPSASDRQHYQITVRPEPGVDDKLALRALLKVMLRRFGLRCTAIVPVKPVSSDPP